VIDDLPSCAELVDRIMTEATHTLSALSVTPFHERGVAPS
jgi:hypothetical protein